MVHNFATIQLYCEHALKSRKSHAELYGHVDDCGIERLDDDIERSYGGVREAYIKSLRDIMKNSVLHIIAISTSSRIDKVGKVDRHQTTLLNTRDFHKEPQWPSSPSSKQKSPPPQTNSKIINPTTYIFVYSHFTHSHNTSNRTSTSTRTSSTTSANQESLGSGARHYVPRTYATAEKHRDDERTGLSVYHAGEEEKREF